MRSHHDSIQASLAYALVAATLLSCAGPQPGSAPRSEPPVAAVLDRPWSSDGELKWNLGWEGEPPSEPEVGRFTALRGWATPEPRGRWTVGPMAAFAVDSPAAGRWVLEVRARTHVGGLDGAVNPVGVTVNREPAPDLAFSIEPSVARTTVELREGRNIILMRPERVEAPPTKEPGQDVRVLGMMVSSIRLRPDASRTDHPQAVTATDPSIRHLPGPSGSSVIGTRDQFVAPVRIPDDGGRLNLAVTVGRRGDEPAGTAVATFQPLGGGPEHTLSAPITRHENGPATIRLQWPDLAGRVGVLTLTSDTPGRFIVDGIPPPSVPLPEPAPAWTEHPDIVVLVLDAMRADALGATRHGRAMTPRLDELVERSVVFEEAFALTPYTVASLATVHSGLGFHDHGVVMRDHRLSEEVITVAEALAEVGYRTVAVSATPNNSPALGFDQGFETFVEGWTGRTRRDRLDPFHVTRLAEEQLEADDDRPLFLFVHYVHPHEPYKPSRRFDVFTDPDYHGTITGQARTFKELLLGTLVPTARDRRHLEDLYAGNMLAVDAAVGSLLDRLATRDRWDHTAVVLTSDHGEELFERGLVGHNRTVYAEMLHVPLVVRIPGRLETEGVAHDRVVTLQDIAPTLARIAGAPLPWPVGAVDLLAPPDNPGTLLDRWVLTRNADGVRPVYGVRSAGFSAVLYPWGDGELYNLGWSEGEVSDVRARRPEMFAGLSLLAQRELWRTPFVPEAGAASARTAEELEMLRVLGYVD